MALSTVTDVQLRDLLGKGKAVVADFYADWCQPCHAIAPELEKLAEGSEGEVEFVKIDVDAHPEITMELGIRSIPTVIHFSADGAEFARTVGAARGEDLARRLRLVA
jgi:thioredoxin 1